MCIRDSLTAFLFSVGAGTSNIIYPLLPVIYDVSYKNGIRPSRPMSITVVQAGVALAASPVSAAMAAMLTLTDVAPYELGLAQILAITFPACIIGIIVTSVSYTHLDVYKRQARHCICQSKRSRCCRRLRLTGWA